MFSSKYFLVFTLNFGLAFCNLLVTRHGRYSNPRPCCGDCSGIHDPTILKRDSDGTYFRLSTDSKLSLASAPALEGPWTQHGSALPQGSSIHLLEKQQLWAPDLFKINDTYYSYYSVSYPQSHNSQIGLMSSPSMDLGSWTDHGSVGLHQSETYNLIDPNRFVDFTGQAYTNFGSGWGGVFQIPGELNLSGGVSLVNTIYNSTFPTGIKHPDIVEGAYEFAWNGAYYMFFSSGACCQKADKLSPPGEEYKIMVCKSDSPFGPSSDKDGKNCATQNGGTQVLGSHGNVYAPGGQGVLIDDNAIVLYYHYVNPKISYEFEDFQFGYNYLDFSSGWPVVTP